MEKKLRTILTKEDCKYLLSQSEKSYASSVICSAANQRIRRNHDNAAIMIGQVGTDIRPCEAGYKFCSFGEGHTATPRMRMDKESLQKFIPDFCRKGDLYGLFDDRGGL